MMLTNGERSERARAACGISVVDGQWLEDDMLETNLDMLRRLPAEKLAALPVIGQRFCDTGRALVRCETYHGDCAACVGAWLMAPVKKGEIHD